MSRSGVANGPCDDRIAAPEPGVQFRETPSHGQVVADSIPAGEGFSVARHAPISGEASDVTRRGIKIGRSGVR